MINKEIVNINNQELEYYWSDEYKILYDSVLYDDFIVPVGFSETLVETRVPRDRVNTSNEIADEMVVQELMEVWNEFN